MIGRRVLSQHLRCICAVVALTGRLPPRCDELSIPDERFPQVERRQRRSTRWGRGVFFALGRTRESHCALLDLADLPAGEMAM